MTLPERTFPDVSTTLGTVAKPTVGRIESSIFYGGNTRDFKIVLSLFGVRLNTTDAGASGSYASQLLFTFIKQGISITGGYQNWTAFAEGATLTSGGAGNVTHVLGVGSTAIATARDGTLTSTEHDVIPKTGTITDSGGTGAGSQITGAYATGLDGTVTAKTLNLNWSGFAATSNASSTIDVTGTITVTGVFTGP